MNGDLALQIVRDLAETNPIRTVDGVVDYVCGVCGETSDHYIWPTYSEPPLGPEKFPHEKTCIWMRAKQLVSGAA